MTQFDEIWRLSATPVLNEHFGETSQATYYDGAGTDRGSYDVILSPEEAIEDVEKRGRQQTRYRRTATVTYQAGSLLWESTVAPSGTLVIVENESNVTYAIVGVLSRSASALVLILQRTANQRQWKAD